MPLMPLTMPLENPRCPRPHQAHTFTAADARGALDMVGGAYDPSHTTRLNDVVTTVAATEKEDDTC